MATTCLAFTLLIVMITSVHAETRSVSLQLFWKHQFEFAGFYAAKEKGFYRDVGLEVDIREYAQGMNVNDEVVQGRAQFGVVSSSGTLSYLKGEPVVLVANIFKHSALILLSHQKAGIRNPNDLVGKRVMLTEQERNAVEFRSLFAGNGIDPDQIEFIDHSFDVMDIVEGRADVMSAYITNQPFILQELGIPYSVLDPASYGVDFYGDSIITSLNLAKTEPGLVDTFRDASVKGWQYALDNPDEIIDLIIEKYNTGGKSRAALEFEAAESRKLILPAAYALGSIDEARVRRIANSMRETEITDSALPLSAFVFSSLHETAAGLTPEEVQWARSNTVKIGIETWPPLVFPGPDQQPSGMAGDFLNLIGQRTGLKFEYVFDEWDPLLEGLRDKSIDLLPATYYTDERATFGLYSEPYFHSREFIYVKQANEDVQRIGDLATGKIAIVKGYGTIPKLRAEYPNATIIETKDLLESIDMVLSGDVDALFEAQVAVEQTIADNAISGLKSIAQNVFPASGLHLFSRIDAPILHSILEKGLASISPVERRELQGRWFNLQIGDAPKAENVSVVSNELIVVGAIVLAGAGLMLTIVWLVRSQNRPFLRSLRGKSIIFIFGVFMLIIGVSWWALTFISEKVTIDLGTDIAERHVLWHKERVLGSIQRELALAEQMAESELLMSWAGDVNDSFVSAIARDELQRFHDNFSGKTIFVGLKQSGHFYYADKSVDKIVLKPVETLSREDPDDGWFFATMEDKAPYNLNVDHNTELGVTNLWVNYALRNADDTLGVVGTGINLTEFVGDFIKSDTRGVSAMMISGNGAIQAHTDPSKIDLDIIAREMGDDEGIWKLLASEDDRQSLKRNLGLLENDNIDSASMLVTLDGVESLIAISYLAPLDWYSVAVFEPSALVGFEELGTLVAVLVFTLLIAITVFLLGHNSLIIRPLKELSTGTQRLSSGDYDVRLKVAQQDEIGDLTNTFNDMASTISDYTRNLETMVADRTADLVDKENRIRSIFETSNEGIWMVDNDAITTQINDSLAAILDRESGDVVGKPLFDFLDEPSKEIFAAQFERRKKGESTSYEVSIERADGNKVPVVINGTPLYDGVGEKIGAFGMVTDITELKQKEEQLVDAYSLISDSIEYASNIQRALLAGEAMLSATMQENFVLWEPRDVVGGDIYWCHMWGDGVLVIQADCTGHGVPGAFMTLISTGALDRAMGEVEPGQVGKLIQRMHQIVQIMLSQHGGSGSNDDGLELGACFISADSTQLRFSGARFSLFIAEDGDISEIKSTRSGLGYRGIPIDQTFEETDLAIKDGMKFYLTTDGFTDQVGGENRRMFGKKRFKNLLLSAQDKPMTEQREILYTALREYQGDEIRRDDVSVLGFKV